MFGSMKTFGGTQSAMRLVRFGFNALIAMTMVAPAVLAQKETETAVSAKQEAKAGFPRVDAAELPIEHKFHVGGDPDWLGIGLGSVWVAIPRTDELVRIDPVGN